MTKGNFFYIINSTIDTREAAFMGEEVVIRVERRMPSPSHLALYF